MLSVVIPSYNEEDNIGHTSEVIGEILSDNKIDYELIFVDDGSKDKTWEKIKALNSADSRVRGVSFSRNFGKEGAILAGLEACRGDAAVVIDCDLQHPPQVIPKMYELWRNGAMVVEGKKSSRGKESKTYGALSGLFYRLIESSSRIDMKNSSDFKLLDRTAIDALLSLPERGTFFRALSGWVGFETAEVYYDVAQRFSGKRKWTTGMLFNYAIKNLAAFTSAPLYICGVIGLIIAVAAFVLIVLNAVGVNTGSFDAAASVLMLIGGGILCCMAIAGYYISRIYDEVKRRPRYIVARTTEGKLADKGGNSVGGN